MDDIKFRFVADGLDKVTAAMTQLEERLGRLESAQGKLKKATDETQRSTEGLTKSGGGAAQTFARLGPIAGMAAQSLNQLGTGTGRVAQVLGQATSAVGSLSAGMGPLGIAIAAGSAAFAFLVQHIQATREEAARLDRVLNTSTIPSLQSLIALQRDAAASSALTSRILNGRGTVEENTAAQTQARARAEQTRNRIAELSRADAERRRAFEESGGLHLLTSAPTEDPRLAGLRHQLEVERENVGNANERLADARRREAAAGPATDAGAAAADGQRADERRRAARRTSGGGGGGADREADRAERERLASLHQEELSFTARIEAARDANRDKERAWHDEQLRHIQEEADNRRQAIEVQDSMRAEAKERERSDREAADEEIQKSLATIGEAGERVGGVLVDAFVKATSGQKNFGKALAEGAKVELTALGKSEAIKAIVATAEGIGLTFLNPPAAASKFAEAGLHVAAAAAAGVGAAAAGAIAGGGGHGGGGGGGRGDRPVATSGGGGGGGSPTTTIINWNSPVITAGTHHELGDKLRDLTRDAAARNGDR